MYGPFSLVSRSPVLADAYIPIVPHRCVLPARIY